MFFDVAGIYVPLWVPPIAAFVISFFCSMVGISGAVLLVPFQMTVLGFVTPSVSATNLVFNLVAIPAGAWRYAQEKRMDWQLAWLISASTLPGMLIGWWVRLHWLLKPQAFKLFAAALLLWLATRLISRQHYPNGQAHEADTGVPKLPLIGIASVVGVIGGAYGIGGGSIIAPLLVVIFRRRLYRLAGATLLSTLVTSIAGVAMYQLLPAPTGIDARPDWRLGILFGIGGAFGMYLGARTQKHVPHRALQLGIAVVLLIVSVGYGFEFSLKIFR